jgi:protoporphyrinogen/coproporphyrinogen III oxidase
MSAPGRKHVVVIGGGISGLAAVERLARDVRQDIDVTLLESGSRLGGVIQTDREDGFVMESGPDVMLAAKPAAVALCERLGIAARLHGTRPEASGSFILSDGTLHKIPAGMGVVPTKMMPFVRSGLLSPLAKARVGLEYLLPRGEVYGEESVEQFIVRRLGRTMYERLVEPLLSGIFAGDGSRLSLQSTFPHLQAMEREHGGLLRGMLAARAQPVSTDSSPPRLTGLVSFPTGLSEMIEAIEQRIVASDRLHVRRGALATAIARMPDDARYAVTTTDGSVLLAEAVIAAIPAHAAAALVGGLDKALASELAEIEHASTVTINLAFQSKDLPAPLAGTGYTVPRVQGRPVLACTFSSNKFSGRAPDGRALFRVFLGGAGRGDFVDRDDADLTSLARTELREVLGITVAPDVVKINRMPRAMPQYNVGHRARLERIDARLATVLGLQLAGNGYQGVGIPDCVKSGERAAERALASFASVPMVLETVRVA